MVVTQRPCNWIRCIQGMQMLALSFSAKSTQRYSWHVCVRAPFPWLLLFGWQVGALHTCNVWSEALTKASIRSWTPDSVVLSPHEQTITEDITVHMMTMMKCLLNSPPSLPNSLPP